jgi:AAA+ ATPase superfamily predicted ATPase
VSKPFKNRTLELADLNQIAAAKTAQMEVIYGRRRIGKTSLLRYWAEQHSAQSLYWTGYRTTSEQLLESFSARIAEITPGVTAEGLNFRTWEAAFTHLFTLAADKTVIAVIDEFPYLVEMESAIPSLLQRLWDEYSGSNRLILAICGSHYHMMHEEFASSRKPLYGRAQRHLIIDEIIPKELGLFLPRYSPEQIVETYGVTGRVPAYLELWDDKRPVAHNIKELLLRPATFFSQEAILLIHDEIAEPRTYLGLLQALGGGFRTPKQLADTAGIHLNHVGKYLKTLVDLRFVRRVLSEDSEDRAKSRNSK